MMDLFDAVERMTYLRKRHGAAEKHGEGLFLPVPVKGKPVEIRGSLVRYVSMPGQLPADAGTVDSETSRKKWDRLRRKVAANARIK